MMVLFKRSCVSPENLLWKCDVAVVLCQSLYFCTNIIRWNAVALKLCPKLCCPKKVLCGWDLCRVTCQPPVSNCVRTYNTDLQDLFLRRGGGACFHCPPRAQSVDDQPHGQASWPSLHVKWWRSSLDPSAGMCTSPHVPLA
jgi:hypothetical protein